MHPRCPGDVTEALGRPALDPPRSGLPRGAAAPGLKVDGIFAVDGALGVAFPCERVGTGGELAVPCERVGAADAELAFR